MNLRDALDRVLLGESLRQIAFSHRADLLTEVGLSPEEARPTTFRKETENFMRKVCRALSERHPGDTRAAAALQDFVHEVDQYEAFDALLTGYGPFEGREAVIRRGRTLFPGPLTAHWDEE